MGRFYNGDITGKFWFGIQESNDISNLIDINYIPELFWKICNCGANPLTTNYCNICFSSNKEHMNKIIEENEYDDRLMYYEQSVVTYEIDKELYYNELNTNMNKLKLKIPAIIIDSFDNIQHNDDILNAFTGVFDHIIEILNNIKNTEQTEDINILSGLVARYIIGFQIQYYLKNHDHCTIYCEC